MLTGLRYGAKWSLVLAFPFGVWVFYMLYRINTEPTIDGLTDKQFPNPLTAMNFLRCASGAIIIPLVTVVFPASAACGIYYACWRRSVNLEDGG